MRNLSLRRFEDAASNKPRSCMLLLMVTRKNAALLRLVAQTRPRRVVFYDDVAANVDGARRLFDARGDLPPLETVLVPLAESLAALEAKRPRAVRAYAGLFAVVGPLAHCNFLPWT